MARVNNPRTAPDLFGAPAATPTDQSPAGGATAQALLPLPLGEAYDYRVPVGMDLAPGDVAEFPLGARAVIGVVWGTAPAKVSPRKLKTVIRRLPAPPLGDDLRAFIDWVAADRKSVV